MLDQQGLISLIQNSGVLISLVLLHQMLPLRQAKALSLHRRLLSGIILGGIGIAVMYVPWELLPGLRFDARAVLLGIAALFFGPLPTVVAGLLTALFRIYLGGDGAMTGVFVVINTVLFGLLWQANRHRWGRPQPSFRELLIYGFGIHLVFLATLFFLPNQYLRTVFREISLPLLLVFPLVTALLGQLIVREERRRQNESRIKQNEQALRAIFENLPVMLDAFNDQDEIVAWNAECERVTGYTAAEMIGTPEAMGQLYPVPGTLERMYADFEQHNFDSGPFETTLRSKDGTSHTIAWYAQTTALPFPGWRNWAIGADITARKQAEEALVAQTTLLQTIIDSIPVLIAQFDAAGEIQFVNQEWIKTLGWTVPEIQAADDLLALFYPDPELQALTGEFMQVHRGEWREFPTLSKDGKTYNITWTNVHLADGRIIGIGRDLTERRETERALASSEQLFETVMQLAPVGIFQADVHGRFTFYNQEMERVTGFDWSLEEINQRWLEAIHPDDRAMVMEHWGRVLAEGRPFQGEFRLQHADGTVRWVLGDIAIWAGEAQPRGFIGAITDVTALRTAEAKTAETAHRLELAAQAAEIGIWELNLQTYELIWDERMYEMYGIPPDRPLTFAHWNNAVHPDDVTRMMEMYTQGDDSSGVLMDQFRIYRPDGELRHLATRSELQRDAEGIPQRLVGVNWDITEQVKNAAYLQRQERLAALGQLSAGIAHDFNNIMGVIVLYAEMLQLNPHLPADVQKRLKIIEQQANRATALIQQILDFSRRSVLERKPLDFHALMEEQIALLERTLPENITLSLQAQPDDYMVQADATRMQQVIMNLALNARDALPDGGRLAFTLERFKLFVGDTPPLADMAGGDWLRLAAADTGVGIPADDLDHIFEPFFTTKDAGKGTGLGLAQIYGIVVQHGGHIAVESELNRGTTFTIYLPALPEALENPETYAPVDLPEGEGECIFIVEDEEMLREALVESLEQRGYMVLSAPDGRAALRILDAGETAVDLIISDVIMPRMGGVDLLQAMRRHGHQQPLIFVSGHTFTEKMSDLTKYGVKAFLSKPIDHATLMQAVGEALREAS